MSQLHYLSVASFSGQDAGGFLHDQLSADISALEPGGATFACYCSPRGQVIGLLLVCRAGDEFLVAAAAGLLPSIVERLRMFVLRARVEISVQPEMNMYGLPATEPFTSERIFKPAQPDLRYLISDESQQANGALADWRAEELRQGIVWLGPDTTERFIPQMLGFERIGAVSFSKGCYPGQEIIARARYLGSVKRQPLLLKIGEETAPGPGARVELRFESELIAATVVDSVVVENTGALLFLVASAGPASEVSEMVFENRSYRCATI